MLETDDIFQKITVYSRHTRTHTQTHTLVLRFRLQNLGFLRRCPLICWRGTWGRGLGSETDTYLLLLSSGVELQNARTRVGGRAGDGVSAPVTSRGRKCVDEGASE